MSLFDAHCHLQDPRLGQRLPELLARWSRLGKGYLACCATDESDWAGVAAIARNHPRVIANFGVHPWQVNTLTDRWADRLEGWLCRMPSGVGEIGLDFTDPSADRSRQEAVFLAQLDLANQLGRPVSIHIRRAWDRFIHILKSAGPLSHGGLIHSYSGSADMVPLFEGFNLYISFSGSITNPRNKKAAKALGAVSVDRLLIETDSPDLMPKILAKGPDKINTPDNLMVVAQTAAETLGRPVQDLVDQTFENGIRLFESIITRT